MSTTEISNTVGVVPVTEYKGTEMPPEGRRMIVLYYKKSADRPNPPKPKVAFVIPVTIACEPENLQKAVQEAINDMQESVLRDLVENSGKDYPQFTDPQFTSEAIASWAAQQSAGKKLNKETIGTWFDADVSDALMQALVAVLGPQAEPTKLAAAAQMHRVKFCDLAAPRSGLTQNLAKQLLKAAALAKDSQVKQTIVAKLEPIANQSDTEFFGL